MGSCLDGSLSAEQVLARWWAGVCSDGCLPTPCPQKKSIAYIGRAPARHGPSKSKGTHPVSPRPRTHLLEAMRAEGLCLAEEEPRGVPSCALCRARIPWDSSCSSRSCLRVERLWRSTASVLLLPAHGETSPCGKCQSAIRIPLPPRFGHRSLMSGGKQIKSHRMPAGECVCVGAVGKKMFSMSFCPA